MDDAPLDVLDGLAALVEKSLVVFDETSNRYRLGETVRQYARDRFGDDAPEALFALRNRHADYFYRFAHAAAPDLQSARQAETLNGFQNEVENLRGALEWLPAFRPADALNLAADLFGFWSVRALLSEGRAHLARVLDTPQTASTDDVSQARARGRALNGAGTLALLQADYLEATRLHDAARALFAAYPDDADAKNHLSDALHGLGNVVYYEQRYDAARALWNESRILRKATGDKRRLAASLHSLGNLAMRENNDEDARDFFTRALRLRREVGELSAIAGTLGGLGQLCFSRNELKAAQKYAGEALQIFAGLGVWWAVALGLSDMARAAEAEERWDDAAFLLSASSRLRETVGFPHPPVEAEAAQKRQSDLRDEMGEAAFSAAWEKGQTSGPEEAARFASSHLKPAS